MSGNKEQRKQLFTTEHETFMIGAVITTDGAGAPTLSHNVGVASVSKTATGTYKLVLKDDWTRLVSSQAQIKLAAASDYVCRVSAHDATHATAPYITIMTEKPGATIAAQRFAGNVGYLNPIAAELITIAADALMVDGVAHTLTGVQPDFPRPLSVRITDGDTSISAGTVTVVGTAYDGSAQTEDIDISGGGTATYTTVYSYATVTSVTPHTLTGEGAGDNLSVGVAAGLGLPIPKNATGVAVIATIVDGTKEAVAGLDTTGLFIAPTTAANGAHDYDFYYQYTLTGTSTAAAADLLSGEIHVMAMVQRR